MRNYSTIIGVDLGGARGKTTAVARLTVDWPAGDARRSACAQVEEVLTRHPDAGDTPWRDDALIEYLGAFAGDGLVAIDAPLTLPACVRCQLPACPGQAVCEVPAVVWLNTEGRELMEAEAERLAAMQQGARSVPTRAHTRARLKPLAPYIHRCTDVLLRNGRRIRARETLGQGNGPITARATHLRRALAASGYELNRNLVEVSPRATVHALFGARSARGYKRDADPWEPRAGIVESLGESLRFAPTSRLSREEMLRNDHCFEAVLSAFTGFLWARDDWQIPEALRHVVSEDGWIWAPE